MNKGISGCLYLLKNGCEWVPSTGHLSSALLNAGFGLDFSFPLIPLELNF